MCLCVWSVYRYTGSLSKWHSRCLRHPRKVFILCRSLICSGSEPFRPEEQLMSVEGEIFLVTNLATPLGNEIYINWYDLPQFLNSCLNLGSISNSLQLDLPFDLVNFGLKLSDLFRSELFWLFMLFFTINPSIFSLIWSFSDLIFRSPLCFGFIQGTTHVLLARSGATTWVKLEIHGATSWI